MVLRSSRGRPINAPAASYNDHEAETPMLTLVACIGVEAGVWIGGTPPRIHCGLPTQALLFSHFGGWLQHRHLGRGHRETPNLILWLLGSSRARSTEDDNCCSQSCRSHNQDLLFHGPTPCWGCVLNI